RGGGARLPRGARRDRLSGEPAVSRRPGRAAGAVDVDRDGADGCGDGAARGSRPRRAHGVALGGAGRGGAAATRVARGGGAAHPHRCVPRVLNGARDRRVRPARETWHSTPESAKTVVTKVESM